MLWGRAAHRRMPRTAPAGQGWETGDQPGQPVPGPRPRPEATGRTGSRSPRSTRRRVARACGALMVAGPGGTGLTRRNQTTKREPSHDPATFDDEGSRSCVEEVARWRAAHRNQPQPRTLAIEAAWCLARPVALADGESALSSNASEPRPKAVPDTRGEEAHQTKQMDRPDQTGPPQETGKQESPDEGVRGKPVHAVHQRTDPTAAVEESALMPPYLTRNVSIVA